MAPQAVKDINLWRRRGNDLSVAAFKKTPLGGLLFIFVVCLLAGLWSWYVYTFEKDNIVQTSAVKELDAAALAPLRWAAPTPPRRRR